MPEKTKVASAVEKAVEETWGADAHQDVVPQMNPQTGELELFKAVAPKPKTEETSQKTEQSTDGEQGEKPNKDEEGWKERYSNLQSYSDKRLNDVQKQLDAEKEARIRLEERLSNSAPPGAPKEASDPLANIDFEELVHQPDKLKKVLSDAIKRETQSAVERVIKESKVEVPPEDMQKAIEDYRIRTELTKVMAEHEDFVEYTDSVQVVLEKQPDATFEQAYQIVKEMGAPKNKPKKDSHPNEKKSDAHPATEEASSESDSTGNLTPEQLAERASKLRTEESVPGSHGKRKGAPANPAEAVHQAFDELGF